MNIFISHNKKQKPHARILAAELEKCGAKVWFDEWSLIPGDSLTREIEAGLAECNILLLIWSVDAQKSQWVTAERQAYLRRAIENKDLRIVPIMVDRTPLPVLIAEYLGIVARTKQSLVEAAKRICGPTQEAAAIQRLNQHHRELTIDEKANGDPLPYKRCPECGHNKFKRSSSEAGDDLYYMIECSDCGWSDAVG